MLKDTIYKAYYKNNAKFLQFLKDKGPYVYGALELSKFILSTYYFTLRRKPFMTKLFGTYKRSHTRIGIDLTYACQLKCFNCNRSCTQAPTDERISVTQIKKFINESVENNIRWKAIELLGGEPTLHPDIFEIMNLLLEYKRNLSNDTHIHLVTNGFGEKVNKILRKVPKEIRIIGDSKKSPIPLFSLFNDAPQDWRSYKPEDYSNGCPVLSHCGMGLSPYGYYCCGIAAGIDRIFSFDIGRKHLPSHDDLMVNHLQTFCKLCGMFASFKFTRKEFMSHTWKMAYENYKIKKPKLTFY